MRIGHTGVRYQMLPSVHARSPGPATSSTHAGGAPVVGDAEPRERRRSLGSATLAESVGSPAHPSPRPCSPEPPVAGAGPAAPPPWEELLPRDAAEPASPVLLFPPMAEASMLDRYLQQAALAPLPPASLAELEAIAAVMVHQLPQAPATGPSAWRAGTTSPPAAAAPPWAPACRPPPPPASEAEATPLATWAWPPAPCTPLPPAGPVWPPAPQATWVPVGLTEAGGRPRPPLAWLPGGATEEAGPARAIVDGWPEGP